MTFQVLSDAIRVAIPGREPIVLWAAENIHLDTTNAAAGKYQPDFAPYQIGILMAFQDPATEEIVLFCSSQVGKTLLALIMIAYAMANDPGPIMMVQPTETAAAEWSTQKLVPILRSSQALASVVYEAKMRDSENAKLSKSFLGGFLAIASATSATQLSGKSIRFLILDELDLFPPDVGGEGDPVKLAEKRTTTFAGRRKKVKLSTPRLKPSRIEQAYEATDRRRYLVPCPHCDEPFALEFEHLKWDDGDPSTAYMVCPTCAAVIDADEKPGMLARGQWVAQAPFRGRAGFFLNELYSPFVEWAEVAENFLESKDDPKKMKAFANLSLAQPWEERGGKIEFGDLSERCEPYESDVPAGVAVLTSGVDVQGDRLEVQTLGFTNDLECYVVDYSIFQGDPSAPDTDVWHDLREYLLRDWYAPDGVHRITAMGIDSGGHSTQDVYKFAAANRGRRVFALKGWNQPGKPISGKPSRSGDNRFPFYMVGTEGIKDKIVSMLAITDPGPGYVHFPLKVSNEYFKQLRSEKPVTQWYRGQPSRRWQKIKSGARTEALDTFVYGLAALHIVHPNFERIRSRILPLPDESETLPAAQSPAPQRESKNWNPFDRGGFDPYSSQDW